MKRNATLGSRTSGMHRIALKGVGAAAGTALIAAAVIGASPAHAAHNPRPGGQGGAPAGQLAPQGGPAGGQLAPQGGRAAASQPSTTDPSAPVTAQSVTAATPQSSVAGATATKPVAAGTSTAGTATASTTTAPGVQPQGGPRPAGVPLRSLVGAGTITADQARAVREQLRADAQAAREQARTTALTTLVSEGELTQAQADAIVAAGRGGLRTLVGNGTLTQEQARAVQAEFAEYGSTDTSAASLAALVAAGVLTQAQADAIAALIPPPASGS